MGGNQTALPTALLVSYPEGKPKSTPVQQPLGMELEQWSLPTSTTYLQGENNQGFGAGLSPLALLILLTSKACSLLCSEG
jgi:hypothetical protein